MQLLVNGLDALSNDFIQDVRRTTKNVLAWLRETKEYTRFSSKNELEIITYLVYNARDTIFWWEKFATSYPDLVYPALSPKKVNTDLLIGNT